MKAMKILFPVALLLSILFSADSCKKIQEDELVNGLWRFNTVTVNDSISNYLLNLPQFANGNGCCNYKVDFQRNNVVFAYYMTNDTFNYVVAGNWYLIHYNQMYMKFDKYFDGTFDIKKESTKKYELSSDANHMKVYDGVNPALDTTATKIEMERI